MDIFSAGCVLYELYTGRSLLPTTDVLCNLFAFMEKVIGHFDREFADRYSITHTGIFTNTTPPLVIFDDPANSEGDFMKDLAKAEPLIVRVSHKSMSFCAQLLILG